MTIEEAKEILKPYPIVVKDQQAIRDAIEVMVDATNRYLMMQADYNARLKADMVAMLTDIQLEIDEHKTDYDKDSKSEHDIYYAYDRCSGIVQSKINSLRGNNDA